MAKNTNGITFLDFFAGIGGFRTAVERLGGKCLGFAEIDKHARQSYKALYNTEGEREWHDITQVTDTEFVELAGKVDLINAGFPCQAFSVAGKRQGFDDSRGTLFYEVARAAKAIRPKYILLENVKGLLSHDKGNTVDVIFRTLNEIGYTIDFTVLNSKHFGVPQNRERIFIMAVRDDLVTQEAWNIEGTGVVAKAKRRFSGYEGIKSFNFFGWSAQHTTVSKRLRDVLEAQVDEKFYLSDEKTAQLIEKSQGTEFTQTTQVVADLNHYSQEALNRIYGVNGQAPTIDTMQGGGREPKIAEPTIECLNVWKDDGKQTRMQDRVYASDGISVALTSFCSRLNTTVPEVRATLTPDRVEKRQQGRRFKENDEAAFTVNCVDRHGVMIGTQPNYRIRKLTVLECWRLQGFSDEQHQKAVDAGVSNSQRYKQAGNSVTVNVIEAIVTQLIALDGTIQNESTEVA